MHITRPIVALLALLAASAVGASPRCEQPRQPADRIACQKAAEGADALRRFVTRTQGIYQLYYWDYVGTPPAAARHGDASAAAPMATAVASSR
jgi:hypothetical protein